MKLLTDVNVSALVVARLRGTGLFVERVPEVLDARAPDSAIVHAARERGSILLTHDQDLTTILAVTGAARPSLLNLRTTSVEPDFLARCILRALAAAAPDLEAGAVVTIEDGGIRVRRLPVRDDV